MEEKALHKRKGEGVMMRAVGGFGAFNGEKKKKKALIRNAPSANGA